MRTLGLLGLICVFLVGCGTENEEGEARPQAGDPSYDFAGVYEVDLDALRAEFLAMFEREVGASGLAPEGVREMRRETIEQLRSQFSGDWGRFEFHPEGTFDGGGRDGPVSGTWRLVGVDLEVKITEEDGRPAVDPTPWYGEWRGAEITLRPEPEKGYVLTLRPVED